MASLNWIGKQAVVNHDKQVPFRLLKKVKSASIGDSQNLIVHGDNLEALKALMPHYIGKIKCIYIDPPYNTGNEEWIYNDKVNSPKIKQWIGRVVGAEGEDLTRHDKWLCMMYPRLKLLRDLLRKDGIIFVSLDDNEIHSFRFLMDEIFGEKNFVAQVVRRRRNSQANLSKNISPIHEYLVCYQKTENAALNKIKPSLSKEDFSNPDDDPRGPYVTMPCTNKGGSRYKIVTPTGVVHEDEWRFKLETYHQLVSDNRLVFPRKGDGKPRYKLFYSEKMAEGVLANTWWDDVASNQQGSQELKEIFDGEYVFDNPKPIDLIQKVLQLASSKEDIILDSFAGSGTTGHAVLDLNHNDGGNRKFILIEMEDKIARNITAERIKRVISKYKYNNGFEYCELGIPLFNEDGQIEESCDFKQFATYLYFTETQTNIDTLKIKDSFIGEYNDIEYYLIFEGINKNTLNKTFLKSLKKTDYKKIIYADRCTLDEDLLVEYNIVFKQIPYEVTVY